MNRVFRTLLAVMVAVSAQVMVRAQYVEGPPTKPMEAKAQRTPVKTVKVDLPSITEVARSDTPVFRGENAFIQKCTFCHAPQWNSKRPMTPIRLLTGVLKDTSPAREAAVREQIRRGSVNMPSFQYTFTPGEVDDLIAYLKTL